MRRRAFAFAPETARVDRHSIDIEHGGGRDRAHVDIVGPLVPVFEGHDVIGYNPGAPAIRTQTKNRSRVFLGNVFALVVFDEVLARRDHARPL